MRALVISQRIATKLDVKHTATHAEIEQCFDNKCGVNLIDDREDNRTDPATLWFIAETNKGRLLKIVYVYRDGKYCIKTAYEPNQKEIDIYEAEGK